MLNHIVIMGRLTRDPELRRTGTGLPVASFSLAVDRDVASRDGGEKETDFIDCVAWRSTAEFVSKYFSKGKMAVVSGRLQIRNWTDRDGNKRRSAEVVADSVYFGDSKRDGDSAPRSNYGGSYGGNAGGYNGGNAGGYNGGNAGGYNGGNAGGYNSGNGGNAGGYNGGNAGGYNGGNAGNAGGYNGGNGGNAGGYNGGNGGNAGGYNGGNAGGNPGDSEFPGGNANNYRGGSYPPPSSDTDSGFTALDEEGSDLPF